MPMTYVNFKGKKYFLHVGETKKGTPRYYFSPKKEGDLAEELPEGYEIYENPNGWVYLRKIQPKLISDEEIGIVKDEMQRRPHLKKYNIDVTKDAIIIYEPDRNPDDLAELVSFFGRGADMNFLLEKTHYIPIFQFVLTDKEKRIFSAQRWRFSGAIEGWIPIGISGKLEKLARKYIKHIGKESFYELD